MAQVLSRCGSEDRLAMRGHRLRWPSDRRHTVLGAPVWFFDHSRESKHSLWNLVQRIRDLHIGKRWLEIRQKRDLLGAECFC